MFGKNKILKPANHDGSSLEVQEIFATFQGEGPFAGYPSIFIRLGGCNLACSFCDTEFDSFKTLSLDQIILQVLDLAKKDCKTLIVITGGEPLRQPIEKLCDKLISLGFLIQIETNGTLFRNLPKEVNIVCSPKNIDGKYHKIRLDLLEKIGAFKFIISASNAYYSSFAEVGQSEFNIPVYLQPMDEYDIEKNQANIKRVVDLAKKHQTRISMQMHKILNIP